jgi:predicted Zn-dependent protease
MHQELNLQFDGSVQPILKMVDVAIYQFGNVDKYIVSNVLKTLQDLFIDFNFDITVEEGEKLSLPQYEYKRSGFYKDNDFFNELRLKPGTINMGITEVGVLHNGQRNPPRFGCGNISVGIESIYRFKKENDGKEKLIERSSKEAIKILSFTYELEHCKDEKCFLIYHPNIKTLDKNIELCDRCKKLFKNAIKDYHNLKC